MPLAGTQPWQLRSLGYPVPFAALWLSLGNSQLAQCPFLVCLGLVPAFAPFCTQLQVCGCSVGQNLPLLCSSKPWTPADEGKPWQHGQVSSSCCSGCCTAFLIPNWPMTQSCKLPVLPWALPALGPAILCRHPLLHVHQVPAPGHPHPLPPTPPAGTGEFGVHAGAYYCC